LKSFLAVSKLFTDHINTSFSQDRMHMCITVCCLFIYLFIYLLLNAAQKETISVTG